MQISIKTSLTTVYFLTTFIYFLLTLKSASGQQYFKDKGSIKTPKDRSESYYWNLNLYDKTYGYDYFGIISDNVLNDIFLPHAIFKQFYDFKKCQLDFRGVLTLHNCMFGNYRKSYEDNLLDSKKNVKFPCDWTKYSFEELIFEKCIFKRPFFFSSDYLSNPPMLDYDDYPIKTKLTFENSYLLGFNLQDFNGKVIMDNTILAGDLKISGGKTELFLINPSNKNRSYQNYIVKESNLSLYIEDNNLTKFDFYKDSLNGYVTLNHKAGYHFYNLNETLLETDVNNTSDSLASIQFKANKCKIPATITINYSHFNKLSLNYCEIGEKLILTEGDLSNKKPKDKIKLSLIGTDVMRIDFNFTNLMEIVFDGNPTLDEKYQLFGALLDKFKKEGKTKSYEFADIQYIKFKCNEYGLLGNIAGNISKVWWNYGYDRNKILFWTLKLLLFFFTINLVFCEKLLTFYRKLDYIPYTKSQSTLRAFSKNFINTFLFTLYIFFSLKVDLDRLDTKRTRLTLYFFFQYFTGLICLFFIFNAILKV